MRYPNQLHEPTYVRTCKTRDTYVRNGYKHKSTPYVTKEMPYVAAYSLCLTYVLSQHTEATYVLSLTTYIRTLVRTPQDPRLSQ